MTKNKNLAVAAAVCAVIAIALLVITAVLKKHGANLTPFNKAGKAQTQVASKGALSKDRGTLVVRIMDSRKKEITLKLRAFRGADPRYSAYETFFVSGKPQELPAGSYDIEVDTRPQIIYKNITVKPGIENIADIGVISGSVNVKALNYQNKNANYAVRLYYSGLHGQVAMGGVNNPVEVLPGTYDVEVGTMPRRVRRGVKVAAGKEEVLEMGRVTGTLLVKCVDRNKGDVKSGARLSAGSNNAFIGTIPANKPVEIVEGGYNIEISASPGEVKKDVRVTAGQETVVEFVAQPLLVPRQVAETPKAASKTVR